MAFTCIRLWLFWALRPIDTSFLRVHSSLFCWRIAEARVHVPAFLAVRWDFCQWFCWLSWNLTSKQKKNVDCGEAAEYHQFAAFESEWAGQSLGIKHVNLIGNVQKRSWWVEFIEKYKLKGGWSQSLFFLERITHLHWIQNWTVCWKSVVRSAWKSEICGKSGKEM